MTATEPDGQLLVEAADRRTAPVAAVVLLGILAAVEVARVYDGRALVVLGGGAAVLAPVVAVVCDRRGIGRLARALFSLVALCLYMVVAVYLPSRDGLVAPGIVANDLLDGWATSLSLSVPVPVEPPTVGFVVVAIWAATAIASILCLRARNARWSAAPMLVLHIGAASLGVSGPGSQWGIVVATVAAFGALLALGRPVASPGYLSTDEAAAATSSGDGRRRELVRAPVVIALCALVALLVVPLLPGVDVDDPYDPREQQELDESEVDGLNPLALVRGWLLNDDPQRLFTLQSPREVTVQLAALDVFTGEQWSVDGSFRGTGSELPAGLVPAPEGEVVDYSITVDDLEVPWLPTVERITSLDTDQPVLFERGNGNLLLAAELGDADAPIQYEATSFVSEVPDDLEAAEIPTTAETSHMRSAPDLPVQLQEVATDITQNEVLPIQKARAIEDRLKRQFRWSTEEENSAPGQSYADLLRLIEGKGDVPGRHSYGTPDQFATAFAVLGRAVGLPTRVVVGFRGVGGVQGGDEVTTNQVRVWPEVLFAGLGWVPFDPSPSPADESPPPESTLADQLERERPEPGDGAGADPEVDDPVEDASAADSTKYLWLLPVVPVVVLVAWVLGIAVTRRRRGRRRRTAADPSHRVQGAWWELTDRMAERGTAPSAAETTTELAVASRDRFNGEGDDVMVLSALVDACRFGEYCPAESEVDASWRTVEQCSKVLDAATGRRQRIAMAFDPRFIGSGLFRGADASQAKDVQQ